MAVSPAMTVEEYEDKIQLAIAEVNTQNDKTVKSLYDLADELDKAQRKMNIAKTSFASGGIVAAALTIAGIVCAPATFGASLGLTIAGVTVGVTSGVGGLSTEVADKIINTKTLRKAEKEAKVFHERGKDMLCLMDNMEGRHTRQFKTFFADTVKRLLKPNLFESILNRLKGTSLGPVLGGLR
ncbi:apolipoprotein L6-like [Haliotis rubra]|uniref:apolipoprotein L6-like n=1 Tax=Haliotis rubra TaxID=36100 RepID=UPI001EE5E096|nr:apolipoprotein L6-like [Haliotis rubra]